MSALYQRIKQDRAVFVNNRLAGQKQTRRPLAHHNTGLLAWKIPETKLMPYRLRLQRLANFHEKLIDLERFEQYSSETFLARADDAVVGIVAEAGHQDHRQRVAAFSR